MPLSAADVRRRGDQIRRRRTALVAGASALAVAAVAVPIFAVVGGNPNAEGPGPAKDPNKVQQLSTGVLLTDEDTVYSDGTDWFRTNAAEGDGQDVFNPCAQQSLTGTGATSVVRADFELRNTDDPEVEVTGDFFTQVVGDYDDEAAATAAYDRISDWVENCEQRPADITEYRFLASRDVPVDGATAEILDSHYGPVPKEIDEFGDAAYIMETGLLRQGDKLVVLTSVIIGQDYNFLDGTPVERMLPAAAERLDPGSEQPDPGDGTSSGDAASVLAPGFDLVHDMVTSDSGEEAVASPDAAGVGELTFCDDVVDVRTGAVERLAANSSGPEYGESREVLVMPSEAEADALVDRILDSARACPRSETDGSAALQSVTDREDQPVPTTVITQTYETDGLPQLGINTWVVARQGPVVLLAMSYSEGSAEPAAVEATTTEFLDRLATTIGWVVDSVGS